MKVVTNEKLISRNSKIGKYTTIGALVILGVGLYISFQQPDLFAYSLVCLLVGFFLSQFGTYYTSRWGRNPRPDEIITKSMKGLGREYTIYHYATPASHLLVSPAGLWILLPYYVAGTVTYEKKRWRIKGGGFARSYLRAFGQESIGRPDLDSAGEIESVNRHLKKILPEGTQLPEIHTVLLFIDPKVELKLDESAPLPAMTPKDLKEFLKARAKETPISELTLDMIRKALPQPEKEEKED